MFRGPKPSAQPRTLRTIAEGKAAPANFPTDLPYDAAAGTPTSGGTYKDAADSPALGGAVRRGPADPSPFNKLLKGR